MCCTCLDGTLKVKMASKGKENAGKKHSRRWSKQETLKFSEVLADPDNGFLQSLEKLALKNSSNDEVFRIIKDIFDNELKDDYFIQQNESNNFTRKDRTVEPYPKLDTSIGKMRIKLKNLKAEWRKITDRSKTGSGLSPESEPDWYKVINCVLSETNSEINLSSNAGETSFCEDVNESNGSDSRESEDSNGGENESDNENVEIQAKGTTLTPESRKGVNKLVVAPHNKRTQVRSNRQALSEMAHSMKAFAEAQVKRHKLSLESEERRDKMQMQFRREESEKNRQHDLKMARIYAESFRGSNVSRPDTRAGLRHRQNRQSPRASDGWGPRTEIIKLASPRPSLN